MGFPRKKHLIYMSQATFCVVFFFFVINESLKLFFVFYNKDCLIDLKLLNCPAAVCVGVCDGDFGGRYEGVT